jgi:hypothetical protein
MSTIAGGSDNDATGIASTVGGGGSNEAGGAYSTIPGGLNNIASGDYSVAAGLKAKAIHAGAFVWADNSNTDFESSATNQFLIRASGGVGIGTNITGSRTLNVIDSTAGTIGQMINFQRTDSAATGNDILQIKVASNSHDGMQFIECERGADAKFRVHGDGDVTADGAFTGGGADFAEMVEVSTGYSSVEAGDVMVIDPTNPRAIVKSSRSRSTLVAGIYSTEAGFIGSERDWDRQLTGEIGTYTLEDMAVEFNEIPLAVVGIVPCKVSAENGAIRPGDLLVTSNSPGYAMRDDNPKVGTVVGKALGSLTSGKDVVKILVTLH